jgi:hypothetical protein
VTRGLGWSTTLIKRVVEDYKKDTTSSYNSLSKKYSVPTGTIQRWIEKHAKPRSRVAWKKQRRPSESVVSTAMFLISLGVPKTKAAARAGISIKMLRILLKEQGNPYEQETKQNHVRSSRYPTSHSSSS